MRNSSFSVIRKLHYFFFLIIIFLNSCQTHQTGTPIPTMEAFDLYYSPSLGYLRENISSCIASLNSIAPYLHEQPIESSTLLPGDVLITLGEVELEMDDYFVTQIGVEKIVFVVNGTNLAENIDKGELREIYSGIETNWQSEMNDEEPISVWFYPHGSDLGDWLSKTFLLSNGSTSVSKLAPNPQVVLESISKESGAIGYLPESWLGFFDAQITDKIRVLSLENSDELRLSIPVLAYMTKEPEGEVRDFLVCLQQN